MVAVVVPQVAQLIAAADTAEQQSAGGGQSAAVGQGALLAGRTRNAGSADAAVGASTRAVGQQLSEGALQTRLKNAGMKMQQQVHLVKRFFVLFFGMYLRSSIHSCRS